MPGPQHPHFTVERADGIARIAFDRVEKHNAANVDTFGQFIALMAEVDRDDDIAVAIVTGNGTRAFCAGVDLDALAIDGAGQAYDWIARVQQVFESIENVRKPVIAAVNGLALGLGMELAMVCDLTIASRSATFGLPEVKHGMLPAVLLTRGLELLGRKEAAWLAMTGETFGADEAKSLGLVNRVVEPHELMPAALATAERLRAQAPLGLRTIKRLLVKNGHRHSLDVADFLAPLMLSDDVKEARAAFLAKRKPVFRGR